MSLVVCRGVLTETFATEFSVFGFLLPLALPDLTSWVSSVHYTNVEHQAPDAKLAHARQLGRTLGIAFFGVVVVAFTAIWSTEICLQVWAPPIQPLTVGCAAGTLQLAEAVDAARLATSEEPGEQPALARFRAVVAPVWAMRPALGKACGKDPAAMRQLREVDRLRYAEEHAVRYGAVDLAKRRQEVKHLIPSLRETISRTP
jgi:hypothetical protein